MFFDDDIIKQEASKNKENFGFFTPNNDTDYNMSLYEAIYDRIYSKWKYHYLLAFSFLFVLSCYYPIFFVIIFMDIIIQYSMLRFGVDNFLAQDVEYDMKQHDVQSEGGDMRLDSFVFLCYDSLGYVIYGVSNVGPLICSEVYDYKNYFGFQNKVNIYKSNNIVIDINDINHNINKKSVNNLNNIDSYLLKFHNKGIINFSRVNIYDLSFMINKLNCNYITNNNYIINNRSNVNYYIFNNTDLCYSYFDLRKI